MLDLSKPLGIHEGLIFYGDHELNDVVYYFPDEVGLSPQKNISGEPTDLYEMYMQVFSEGDITEGGIDALRNSSGSILSLGVQCDVTPRRLEAALGKVKQAGSFTDNLKASLPPWRDGSVNLIVLDTDQSDNTTIGEDRFVKGIVGSKKPSLMSTTLDSVFNVRLDRRGTAIVMSALDGDTGNVAGVLYDLKYTAMRPALNMRIWANLDRCYESVAHQLGVKLEATYYVKFSLGAEFNWLTKKMEEDGDLIIEVISQAEDAETKKMMDEMISDFKTSVLREMFTPYVNPQMPNAPNIGGAVESAVPVIGVSYKFTKENLTQNKILEVDYRERSPIVRTHNPQAHLWIVGKQIAANRDKYIQQLRFAELWREQELTVSLAYNFDGEDADLLSAEVMIWRARDGFDAQVPDGQFSIPEGVDPIAGITFFKNDVVKKQLAWNYDRDEPFGYYHQIRFVYKPGMIDVSTPSEIVTPPVYSAANDLIIFPDTYTFYRKILVRAGNIDFADVQTVDVTLKLRDAKGDIIDVKTITLSGENKSQLWTVRGKDKEQLYIEVVKEYHYKDERPSLTTEALYLQDEEVIVNKPFLRSVFNIIPVVAGRADNVTEILLEIILSSPVIDTPIKTLHRIAGPTFNAAPINVNLSSDKDVISYIITAVTNDAKIIDIGQGLLNSNALIVDLKKVNVRDVSFTWEGRSPDALGLKELKVELRKIGEQVTDLESIIFSGDRQPMPVVRSFELADQIEWRINKRFNNGSREKGEYALINTKLVIVRPD